MKHITKTLSQSICKMLLVMAPVLAVSLQSAYLWGETEIPECLKN